MSRTDKKSILKRSAGIGLAIIMTLELTFTASAGMAQAAEDSFRPDNEDLYFGALEEEIVSAVVTTEVFRGDFSVISAARGEIVYENMSHIFNTISAGTVKFVEFVVSTGDYVKKGDPIARVSVSVSSSDLDSLQAEIALDEANLEEYIASNQAILDDYLQVMDDPTASAADRRMAELLYDRLSVSYKAEKSSRESAIESSRQRYESLKELTEDQYIKSTASGTVGYTNRFRRGDTVGYYSYVATVYDTSDIMIRVNGGSDYLRYNQSVMLSQTSGNDTVEMTGRVVSCKNSTLPSNLIGTDDYIEVYGDASQFYINKDVTVRVYSTVMENALMISKDAVNTDSKGSYVYLYKNGFAVKHYIMTGGSNSENTWIINGLEEGDLCVIK